MPDIATVSVISSAALAGLTVAANVVIAERQRKHEADLSFEARVWEQKSKALFEVIHKCHEILDIDETDESNRTRQAVQLSKILDALHDNEPVVGAYASAECRTRLEGVIGTMRAAGVKLDMGRRATLWMNKTRETIRELGASEGMDKWRRYDEYRTEAESAAVAEFAPEDLPMIQQRARNLIEAARESVRRADR